MPLRTLHSAGRKITDILSVTRSTSITCVAMMVQVSGSRPLSGWQPPYPEFTRTDAESLCFVQTALAGGCPPTSVDSLVLSNRLRVC